MKAKRRLATWGLVLLLLVGAYFANVAIQSHLGRKALDRIGLTIYTLDEALILARYEANLVLADLSAIWCPTSRGFDKKVLYRESVRNAIADGYIFARIEYESKQGQAFRERYEVSGFPNLLILDADGNKLKHLHVTMDPEAFIAQLAR